MTTTGRPREIFDADTVTPEQQAYALDRAINGLRDDDPRQSASKPLLGWQKPVLLSLLAVVVALAVWRPMQTAVGLIGFCTLAYLVTLGDRVLIFRRGLASRPIVIPDEVAMAIPDDELPAYTILVPAYNEPEVVADLIGAMDALEYPRNSLQVLLLFEADDHVTIDAAQGCGDSEVITILSWCRRPSRGPNPRRATTDCTSPPATSSPSSMPRTCRSRCNCAGWWPRSVTCPTTSPVSRPNWSTTTAPESALTAGSPPSTVCGSAICFPA